MGAGEATSAESPVTDPRLGARDGAGVAETSGRPKPGPSKEVTSAPVGASTCRSPVRPVDEPGAGVSPWRVRSLRELLTGAASVPPENPSVPGSDTSRRGDDVDFPRSGFGRPEVQRRRRRPVARARSVTGRLRRGRSPRPCGRLYRLQPRDRYRCVDHAQQIRERGELDPVPCACRSRAAR